MAATNQASADIINNDVLSKLIGTATPTDNTPALSGIRVIDQPIEQRLRYNTSFHAEILSKLNARQMLSERNISSRWSDWDRVDEHCRLYIDLKRGVKKADGSTTTNKREMPWNLAIVIPMSYAILQTYLTQMMAIFTRRDPIIEVSGVGPEDIRPAKVMQAVLAYDQRQTQFLVQLYSLLQSAVKYGFGKMYDCWEETWGWKFTKRPADPFADYLGQPQVDRSWDVLKQHNMVESIDPRLTWHDPRVSVAFEQRAEFTGHRVFCSYLDLLEKSQANGGPYFNIEFVAKLGAGGVARRDTTIARTLKHLVMTGSMDDKDKGFHCKDIMSIRLIPKDWKLGDGERPEYWQFAWVDKTVVIRAHPSQYHHNQHPYSGAESNVDPHMTFNPGAIENLDGLARFANWLYNCFSDDTEILTERGWSRFQDLCEEDKVATVSADAERQLTFEKPRAFFSYDYDGEMIQIGDSHNRRRFDLLVTPNHRMWVEKSRTRTHRAVIEGNTVRVCDDRWWTEGEFITADKMRGGLRVPNTVSWEGGVDSGFLVFEAKQSPIGRPGRRYDYSELKISYDILAPFIGWFVSEGSTHKGYVNFGQKNPKYIPVLDSLFERFPKKFNRFVEPDG